MFTPKTWADRVLLIGIVDRGLWLEEIFQRKPMSRDELYEEKGLDCLDHDAPPKRVSMRKPDTRNTQKSERSEEHTSELQSLMRISYAVFCLKTKITEINLTSKAYIIYTHHNTNKINTTQ